MPTKAESDTDATNKAKFLEYKTQHPELYYAMPENAGRLTKVTKAPVLFAYWQKRIWGADGGIGWRFMLHNTSAYFGFKGFLYQFLMSSKVVYFITYLGIGGTQYGVWTQVISAPYSMKAFWGCISDLLPLFGWRKRIYLSAAATLSVLIYCVLTFFELTKAQGVIALFLFMASSLCVAFVDLLTEASYAEKMIDNEYIGSDIVSYIWVVQMIAGAFASAWSGYFGTQYKNTGDHVWLSVMFSVGIPFSIQLMIPTFWNFMGETRLPEGERGFQSEKWQKHSNIFKVAIINGICVVVNVICQILSDNISEAVGLADGRWSSVPLLLISFVIGGVAMAATYYYLPRIVAHSMVYMFLSSALYVQMGMDVYYTASPACLPDGPHFSPGYFVTFSGIVQNVGGMFGVLLFQAVMSNWTFRPAFWITVVIRSVAGLFEVAFVAGLWKKMGIPDHWSYMLGQTVVGQVAYMMDFMPGVILMSKLCPKGVEGVMYALLAGFSNFGQNISGNLGAFLWPVMGIHIGDKLVGAEGCDSSNLAWAVLIAEVLLPLLAIPLTFWMIPNGRMSGKVFDNAGNEYPPAEESEEESDEEEGIKGRQNGSGTDVNAPYGAAPMPDAQSGQDVFGTYVDAPYDGDVPYLSYGVAPMPTPNSQQAQPYYY